MKAHVRISVLSHTSRPRLRSVESTPPKVMCERSRSTFESASTFHSGLRGGLRRAAEAAAEVPNHELRQTDELFEKLAEDVAVKGGAEGEVEKRVCAECLQAPQPTLFGPY